MMKLKLLILTGLFCTTGYLCGQPATIIFQADKPVTVSIYAPMDNQYNFQVIKDKMELKPHIRAVYDLPVSGFCFAMCTYSDGNRYYLILQENDHLTVDYSDNQIVCKGNNAEGMAFFDRTFNGTMLINNAIKEIFEQNVDVQKNIAAIPGEIDQTIIAPILEQINQLYADGKISLSFKQIIEKNFLYCVYGDVISIYNLLLFIKKGQLTVEDTSFIAQYKDSLYSLLPPTDEAIQKYAFSSKYVSNYYQDLFDTLTPEEQDRLAGKYGRDTFGPYDFCLLYPKEIRGAVLGNAFLSELTAGFEGLFKPIDKEKLLAYMEENYSDSQYLPVIKKLMQQKRQAEKMSKVSHDSIIILENKVNSLKELSAMENLRGKYLYIDLWATWCLPCKQEFQYKDDLHDLLSQYPDVMPVYISIDQDELEPVWLNNINQFALSGYHLRASKSLQADILKQIYKGDKFFNIPRYILMDSNANIINDDLPRPREIDNLRKVFEDTIKL